VFCEQCVAATLRTAPAKAEEDLGEGWSAKIIAISVRQPNFGTSFGESAEPALRRRQVAEAQSLSRALRLLR
jgi:hypothetical protein